MASARSVSVTAVLVGVVFLSGCVVNPVTGQREIALVSSQQEIAIGQEQYAPSQQMQGGSYRTDPQLNAYVNRVGQKLAIASGVDLPYEFVVLNNSVPNAWALPGGKIAVNRGLLTALRNEAELAAVLGHEVAHAAARHGAKRIERGMVSQGVLVVAAIGASGQEYAGEVLGAAQYGASLINSKYSRDAEREADFYGTEFLAKAGYDPYAAVTLQETFVRLAGEGQSSWMQGLLASHPASMERLQNNRMLLKRLRSEGYVDGDFGQPAFAAAMQRTVNGQSAYDAYDDALDEYADGAYEAALVQVNRALAGESSEALFHGLRGSIRLKQSRYDDAVTNFDRAIARDSTYYLHYLNRGLALSKAQQRSRAKADLAQSVRLLPTASAYQVLGQIAEAEGDAQTAKQYYAQAGQSQSAEGQAARQSLMRLELPQQPAKYIDVRVGTDERDRYVLQVRNPTSLAVSDVVIRVELTTAEGVRTTTNRVERIAAGQTRMVVLQVDSTKVQGARAYPVSASLAR
jgi:predicted Zn-dependent protease